MSTTPSIANSVLDPLQLSTLRADLAARRDEIDRELCEHLAFDADETEILRLRPFYERLTDCLRALDEGRYGRCDACGGALSFQRLRREPWTRRCERCASSSDAEPAWRERGLTPAR